MDAAGQNCVGKKLMCLRSKKLWCGWGLGQKRVDVTVPQIRKRVQLGIQRAMSAKDLHH